MPAMLRGWAVSSVIKVALCTAFICGLLLLAYEQLVRYTLIGRAWNGVRSGTLAIRPAPEDVGSLAER